MKIFFLAGHRFVGGDVVDRSWEKDTWEMKVGPTHVQRFWAHGLSASAADASRARAFATNHLPLASMCWR